MATLTLVPASATVTGGTITFSTAPGPPLDTTPAQVVPTPTVPLVRDFVFATLDGDIDDAVTSIVVDDVSTFPTDAELAKAPLYLTIESDLVHPATFEIVKLTSVDFTTLTLTVARGELGTTAQAHLSGTMIKGALTADIVRRFRAALASMDRLPPPDGDVFVPGDQVYVRTRGEFTFTGSSYFQQTDFTGDDSAGASGASIIGPSTETTSDAQALALGVTQWTTVQGGFGTPSHYDGRPVSAAMVTSTDPLTNQAQVLRPFGGIEHQLVFAMHLGADGVDAGAVIGATADGKNGWYLSLTPGASPTMYRIESGALTSLGTFGDPLVANTTPDAWVSLYEDVLRVWVRPDPGGAPYTVAYESFSLTPGIARGNNSGFMANSASCASDTNLYWTSIGSSAPVGMGVMRGVTTQLVFAAISGGVPAESPSVVDLSAWRGAEPWTPVGSSVWGTTLTLGPPLLRFESGDTGGLASIISDIRAHDIDVTFAWQNVTDLGSMHGPLLRTSDDGLNGIYLEMNPNTEQMTIRLLVGGVHSVIGYGTTSMPGTTGGLRNLRVICSGNTMCLYDAGDPGNPIPLGVFHLPPMTQDFGGGCIGWHMGNGSACADASLGLSHVILADSIAPSGWQQKPTTHVSSGPPIGIAPVGSVWLDLNASLLYGSFGDGQWQPLTPIVSYGAPSVTVPDRVLAIDLANYALYVSVGGVWNMITDGTDSGGGGGGTARGLVDMGFYGTITGSIFKSDFVHHQGGLLRAVWDDGGGQWQPGTAAMQHWPTDGSDDSFWLHVQDATLDSSGVASLTTSSDASAGLMVHINRLAMDGLHISFDADVPDAASGFSFGWFSSASLLSDIGTPPYKAWAGSLPLARGASGAYGAGNETGNFFAFEPTVGMSHVGSSGFFGASPQPGSAYTTGSHHWDIRLSLDSLQQPGSFQLSIYMDGTKLFTSYAYLDSTSYEGGYFFLGGSTGDSGTTGPVQISNLAIYEAQQWTRIRTNYLRETRVPLMLLNGWTALDAPSWSIEGDRIRLHGSITGGTAGAVICELDSDMRPDTQHCYMPITAYDGVAGAYVTRTLHSYYNTIDIVDSLTTDTIHLDGASIPRWQ